MLVFLAWLWVIFVFLACGFVIVGLIEDKEVGAELYPLKTVIASCGWMAMMLGIFYAMNRFYGV